MESVILSNQDQQAQTQAANTIIEVCQVFDSLQVEVTQENIDIVKSYFEEKLAAPVIDIEMYYNIYHGFLTEYTNNIYYSRVEDMPAFIDSLDVDYNTMEQIIFAPHNLDSEEPYIFLDSYDLSINTDDETGFIYEFQDALDSFLQYIRNTFTTSEDLFNFLEALEDENIIFKESV